MPTSAARTRPKPADVTDSPTRGLGVVAESASGVAPDGGEPVAVGLGLLDGQLVGQGAPPALRGGVVDLLHHAFAVAGAGRADRHGHAVVLRHPGERGGDPSRLRTADRGIRRGELG